MDERRERNMYVQEASDRLHCIDAIAQAMLAVQDPELIKKLAISVKHIAQDANGIVTVHLWESEDEA